MDPTEVARQTDRGAVRPAVAVLAVVWAVALPVIVLSALWFGLSDAIAAEDGTAEGSGWAAVPYVALAVLVLVTVAVVRRRRT
jgi:hypothetical protein